MTSSIASSTPPQGQATTAAVRANFGHAVTEINRLQNKTTHDNSSTGIRAIAGGGTNSSTASGARSNLGLGSLALLNSLALGGLSDVSSAGASNNQVLTWSSANSRWEPADAAGGGLSSVPRTLASGVRNPTSSDTTGTFPAIDDLYDAAAEVALTSSGNNVAWDMSTGVNFKVDTLGENTTINNPTNTVEGKMGRLRIVQDATGSRTVAWGTNFEFAGGTAPTATTSSNGEDLFYYDVIAASRIAIADVLDIRSS